MKIDNYKEAIIFLESRGAYGIKPGLARMKEMLLATNYANKCKVIHVTGTNGKGSTTAYIEAGLLSTKYKVGTFTSPSLTGLTGYFTLNNEEMLEHEFVFYLNKLLPSINKLDEINNHPSEFEIITMIAILYFEDNAGIAVIETGMGGLHDTTNILTPIVSVITSISIDHQAFLGETLKEISEHKAGIIKQGVPIILGKVTKESEAVVSEAATRKEAKLFQLGKEFVVEHNNGNYHFHQKEKSLTYEFTLENKGIYQSENASLALQVFILLKDFGLEINLLDCVASIKHVLIQNRFETINENPRIIIDGAHNEASMGAFLETVKLDRSTEKHLIISAFKDKPLEKMIHLANSFFNTITLTTFNHQRAYSTEELETLNLDVSIQPDWDEHLKTIIKQNSENSTYYIVGSVFFTSTVKKAINNI